MLGTMARYGPIVVSREDGPTKVKGTRIAIPGTLTTAYLTLRIYEPDFEYVADPEPQGGMPPAPVNPDDERPAGAKAKSSRRS